MVPETTLAGRAESLAALLRRAKDREVLLSLRLTPEGAWLDALRVPDPLRNKGIGSRILEDVTAWADAEGLVISLTADARFGPTDLPRLMQFYRRFGFRQVRRAARGKMRRFPGVRGIAPPPQIDGTASVSRRGKEIPIS